MARSHTHEWVLRRRLATQRVAGPPLPTAADAVRLLTAVQAQDAPLAAWSLGLRSKASTYAGVLAERATGTVVRTHVLRPTWHLVAAEDLRWLLRLTSARVERSMGARHRGLGLEEPVLSRSVDAVAAFVSGVPGGRTRREVQVELARLGLPSGNEQVGHVLLVGELRTVLCSAPNAGAEHRYTLVDEVVPRSPLDDLDRDAALDLLVLRFFGGHGPASTGDLRRWCGVTLAEVRAALDRVGSRLERVELSGEELWFDPAVPHRTTRERPAHLLPTFDEAVLTYVTTGFPRRDPTAVRPRLLSESGGGVVLVGGADVGIWKRTATAGEVRVTVRPDGALDADERTAVAAAAERLAAFLERPLDLRWA
ncbi:MAG TPA: crosslink repair DNA glycosylase YcaQ family protein [Dermatophilaceae bacterium]|nr:crosslink repair DNA glycosylase YcaQ family protein [Dermatophilaceae bacterium]